MTTSNISQSPRTLRDESGFSLIESLIAVTVLSFGLLSIAAGFTQGLNMLSGSQYDIIAREKAAEAIESVFTARDTRTVTWAQIKNVHGESGSDNGVFLDDAQPLTLAGNDGLVNTADDGDMEEFLQPGNDGLLGTEDDVHMPLDTFTREVEITQLTTSLRQLKIIIRYIVGAQTREYTLVTFMSSYS